MFTIEKKRDEDGMEGMQLKSWKVVSFFKVKDVEAEEVASIFHPILHKKKLEVRWGVLERVFIRLFQHTRRDFYCIVIIVPWGEWFDG